MRPIFIVSIVLGIISVISFIICSIYSTSFTASLHCSNKITERNTGIFEGVQSTLLSYAIMSGIISLFLVLLGSSM